mgnify:CR=1 FL=1
MIIKLSEGLGSMFKTLIREEMMRGTLSKLGGLLAKGAFDRVGQRTDYAEYGGAPLLGVDGVVIIGHGRSNAKAVKNMVRVAKQAAEGKMLATIKEHIQL